MVAGLADIKLRDPRLQSALRKVNRAAFLDEEVREQAAYDRPVPIGYEQTTSQPSLIAFMIDALELPSQARVLEIGTGSGYQTALLAEVAAEVYSIDIVEPLLIKAQHVLQSLGYQNIQLCKGDGYLGWPEAAPFDGIVMSAGAARLPAPLLEQLAPNGRLIAPVKTEAGMVLQRVRRTQDGLMTEDLLPVAFVPLTGPLADRDRQ
ncbi:MAG: protein-L-isoaspartate(D-aspartate) O-methyltransferase [Myxococcaceae bacterium]|nr:protein-L-isoaspartate(D-aspartate) O-methyltransferase [Myxococcaceae bacterium]